jgi:hypothetical protein
MRMSLFFILFWFTASCQSYKWIESTYQETYPGIEHGKVIQELTIIINTYKKLELSNKICFESNPNVCFWIQNSTANNGNELVTKIDTGLNILKYYSISKLEYENENGLFGLINNKKVPLKPKLLKPKTLK